MKNTKRRIEPLSFFNHTGISRHLEKMAAKGWMIEKIVNTGWVYRRIEPKNIHFAVCNRCCCSRNYRCRGFTKRKGNGPIKTDSRFNKHATRGCCISSNRKYEHQQS